MNIYSIGANRAWRHSNIISRPIITEKLANWGTTQVDSFRMNEVVNRFAITCFIGKAIYVTGGQRGAGADASKCVRRYDIGKDRWLDVAPMSRGRHSHSSCMLGYKCFVFGGIGENYARLQSIEFRDLGSYRPW